MVIMDILELFARAQVAEKQQGKEAAIALYKEWVLANPANPATHAAYFNLGALQLSADDGNGALASFNEAVRLKPDFTSAVISLGSTLERLGQMDLAIQYWEHAIAALAGVNADTINQKLTVLKQLARVRVDRHEQSMAEAPW